LERRALPVAYWCSLLEAAFLLGQISTAGTNGLADYNLVIALGRLVKIPAAMENVKHFNGGNLFSY
jgi:hypothetical protein